MNNITFLDFYYAGVIVNIILLIVTDNDNMKKATQRFGYAIMLSSSLIIISLSWLFSLILFFTISNKLKNR
jgi:hypothetical protein